MQRGKKGGTERRADWCANGCHCEQKASEPFNDGRSFCQGNISLPYGCQEGKYCLCGMPYFPLQHTCLPFHRNVSYFGSFSLKHYKTVGCEHTIEQRFHRARVQRVFLLEKPAGCLVLNHFVCCANGTGTMQQDISWCSWMLGCLHIASYTARRCVPVACSHSLKGFSLHKIIVQTKHVSKIQYMAVYLWCRAC